MTPTMNSISLGPGRPSGPVSTILFSSVRHSAHLRMSGDTKLCVSAVVLRFLFGRLPVWVVFSFLFVDGDASADEVSGLHWGTAGESMICGLGLAAVFPLARFDFLATAAASRPLASPALFALLGVSLWVTWSVVSHFPL